MPFQLETCPNVCYSRRKHLFERFFALLVVNEIHSRDEERMLLE